MPRNTLTLGKRASILADYVTRFAIVGRRADRLAKRNRMRQTEHLVSDCTTDPRQAARKIIHRHIQAGRTVEALHR